MARHGSDYGSPSKSSPRKKPLHPQARYEQLMRTYLPLVGGTVWSTYDVLRSFRNRKSNSCFPRYQIIADRRGLSRRSVIRHIGILTAVGLLEKEHRFYDDPTKGEHGGQRSNMYYFLGFSPQYDTPGMPKLNTKSPSSSNPLNTKKINALHEEEKGKEKNPCEHPWGEPMGYPHEGSWRCSACGDLYSRE